MHTDAVWCVEAHPFQPLVASASADGTVRVWRSEEEGGEGEMVSTLRKGDQGCNVIRLFVCLFVFNPLSFIFGIGFLTFFSNLFTLFFLFFFPLFSPSLPLSVFRSCGARVGAVCAG